MSRVRPPDFPSWDTRWPDLASTDAPVNSLMEERSKNSQVEFLGLRAVMARETGCMCCVITNLAQSPGARRHGLKRSFRRQTGLIQNKSSSAEQAVAKI